MVNIVRVASWQCIGQDEQIYPEFTSVIEQIAA